MKILVVDDEQLLVKGIKFNLENEGYQVLTAYDGAAAVELARRESLDLIILDLMMPQLSGSEACMKIREFSDVPIIMLTARSEDADMFPDLGEAIPVLLRAEELSSHNGKFAWSGGEFPAGDFSMRNIDEKRYKLLHKDSGKEITEMDESQAFRELHDGAVYMHGRSARAA